VIAVLGSAEYRDRLDTDDAYRRSKFRERVIERFALPDDAHDWLEQRRVRQPPISENALARLVRAKPCNP